MIQQKFTNATDQLNFLHANPDTGSKNCVKKQRTITEIELYEITKNRCEISFGYNVLMNVILSDFIIILNFCCFYVSGGQIRIQEERNTTDS